MSASESRYPRNPLPRDGRRAVDRRAGGLTEDYAKKAKEVDWKHCGTPRPTARQRGAPMPPRQIGPVEQRLLTYGEVRGWVFGGWGEASNSVHGLVQRLAKARLAVAPTQAGRPGPPKSREAELASLVGYLRRSLSFTAVQQQARLLLDRLQLLGEGASEAARRRDTAVHMERQAIRERRAQAVALIQGQSIVGHGFGKLD